MTTPRVRFAPSPTGFMHLGNVRAALMNYLFAQQHNGTFILRIEDTDAQRNTEESRAKIIEDLTWLGLSYSEGPLVGGAFGPYKQSERTALYQEKLAELVSLGRAYRCFCTNEQLDLMRKVQAAQGKPPRYNRTCLNYPNDKIMRKVEAGIPFIWRFKINHAQILSIKNINKAPIDFSMEHFSDFALSRSDGSFTFIFVNFVDDWLMQITHVIRGEDHLSNTASQAAMYDALAVPMPIFWHLPIICNASGEKLSKRDFGFSLNDLRESGYLPEAILNYLAIMGTSVTEEVQSLKQLSQSLNFEKLSSHGGIRYDLAKLQWFNQQWLSKISSDEYLNNAYRTIGSIYGTAIKPQDKSLIKLLELLRTEIKIYSDLVPLVKFYIQSIEIEKSVINSLLTTEKQITLASLLTQIPPSFDATWMDTLKLQAKENNISMKELMQTVRYLLTGNTHGLGINDLLIILPQELIASRLGNIKIV